MTENVEAFLKELAELSKKYEVYLDGCGCCAAVTDAKHNDTIQRLEYDVAEEKYIAY